LLFAIQLTFSPPRPVMSFSARTSFALQSSRIF
jgi:hypothetical protein